MSGFEAADNQIEMLPLFGLGYLVSAAAFYWLVARTARPTPFPLWVWEQANSSADQRKREAA